MALTTQDIYNGPLTVIESASVSKNARSYQVLMIDIGDDTSTETRWDGSVSQSGTWTVDIGSIPLPTGAATETTLAALNAKVTAVNTGAIAGTVTANQGGSWSVGQSGTWNINNISGTISLPTGAATEATLSTLNGKVTACNTGAIAGTVTANQGGTWNITNVSGTVSLPTGAATEATLASLNGKVATCDTDDVTITSMPSVTIAEPAITYTHTTHTITGSNVLALAANASRKVLYVHHLVSSVDIVFLSLDGGAAASSDINLYPNDKIAFFGPSNYTGAVNLNNTGVGSSTVVITEGQ